MTLTKHALIALMALVLAAPVSAQSLKLPATLYTAAMGADWATTYADRHDRSSVEGNPLTAAMVDGNTAPRWIAGAAIDVGLEVAWTRVVGKHHPKLAALGLVLGAVARSLAAVHNAQRLAQWNASRPIPIQFGTVPNIDPPPPAFIGSKP